MFSYPGIATSCWNETPISLWYDRKLLQCSVWSLVELMLPILQKLSATTAPPWIRICKSFGVWKCYANNYRWSFRNPCTSWGWYFIPILTGFQMSYTSKMLPDLFQQQYVTMAPSSVPIISRELKRIVGAVQFPVCWVNRISQTNTFFVQNNILLNGFLYFMRGNRVPHQMDIGERGKSLVCSFGHKKFLNMNN